MVAKRLQRIRRARRTRHRIHGLSIQRLVVFRSSRHIYAQVISSDGTRTLASASTLDSGVRSRLEAGTGNCAAASVVGSVLAERATQAGLKRVAFDRSGFKYHGRVQQLAESARAAGLEF